MAARCVWSTFNVTRTVSKRLKLTPPKFLCLSAIKPQSTNAASSGSSSDSGDGSNDTEFDSKYQIFKASLSFVPEFGWSRKSLTCGAEAEGLPPLAHGMIDGPAELIHFFYQECNEKLSEQLEKEIQKLDEKNEKLHKTEFIRSAVENRLRMIHPYIDTWAQAMAIQTLPQNAVRSWRNLLDLVDEIWYHAGDRSTDFNWYTKRVTLAAVYKSSEIVMIQDRSDDFENTFNFLDRRIQDLISFSTAKRSADQFSEKCSDGLKGTFIVARNMLGMNSRSR